MHYSNSTFESNRVVVDKLLSAPLMPQMINRIAGLGRDCTNYSLNFCRQAPCQTIKWDELPPLTAVINYS